MVLEELTSVLQRGEFGARTGTKGQRASEVPPNRTTLPMYQACPRFSLVVPGWTLSPINNVSLGKPGHL